MTAGSTWAGRLTGGPLHIELSAEPAWATLADDDVLAVVHFGAGIESTDDPRQVATGLAVPNGLPLGMAPGRRGAEVWRVAGPVHVGNAGALRCAASRDYVCGQLTIAADTTTDFTAATEAAYLQLLRGAQALGFPHVLRIWNVLAGINAGDGDAERYRLFNQGRFNAFVAAARLPVYPAASAIGCDGGRSIIYFLAGRAPAQLIENPRQLSAFRYPRAYGPVSPSFSRGALLHCGDELRLFISGTASILGHQSCHAGDLAGQLSLTLANLAAVAAAAEAPGPLWKSDSMRTQLRVYVRDGADAPVLAALLAARVPASVALTIVRGDICRRELLLEIEATVAWPDTAA